MRFRQLSLRSNDLCRTLLLTIIALNPHAFSSTFVRFHEHSSALVHSRILSINILRLSSTLVLSHQLPCAHINSRMLSSTIVWFHQLSIAHCNIFSKSPINVTNRPQPDPVKLFWRRFILTAKNFNRIFLESSRRNYLKSLPLNKVQVPWIVLKMNVQISRKTTTSNDLVTILSNSNLD